MTPEIKSFQQQMNSNRMAAFYLGQSIGAFNADVAQAFSGILRTNLMRYVEAPAIRQKIDSSDNFTIQLRAVMDFCPSFLFVITSELNAFPNAHLAARRLLLACIFFAMDRTAAHQLHIQLFVESLGQKSDLQLSEKLDGDPEMRVLPEVIYSDFMIMAKQPLRFQMSKSSPDLIENLFCFSGISHIFMRYFFDLLAEAKDNGFSQKINLIFSKLFVALRLEELRYWKGYQNSEVVKSRLEAIIAANTPKKRHPKLQKDVFSSLTKYNPILHNGASRVMTVTTQSVLKGQLGAYHSFTIGQLTLLLNIVHRFKGDDYVVFLLSQLIKNNKERLLELNTYLKKLNQKSFEGLYGIVGSFVRRFFPDEETAPPREKPGKPSSQTQSSYESSRINVAKKNIETIKERKGMITHDKVEAYLKERLKKLYEKVRRTGALTQDMIPKYLAQFAEVAQIFLVEVNPARQKEMVEAFEESTDDILSEIARFSEMSSDEVDDIRSNIQEKIGELDTPDLEKRTEVVEEIGMVLSDASEKAGPVPLSQVEIDRLLREKQISIGFDEKAPLLPLGEFFKMPFGDRKGPLEEDWFEYHRRYLELAVENKAVEPSLLEMLPDILPLLPKLKYRKYFNIFPNGEYEDPTCSAVYDIWKSSALERLRID